VQDIEEEDGVQDIKEEDTRPETPQYQSDDDNRSLLSHGPRPPSPPPSPPPLLTPPGFDDTPSNSGRSMPFDGDNLEYPPSQLPDITTSIEFIRMVREATLVSQFGVEELDIFSNPQEVNSSPEDDPYLKFSIQNFISLLGCAQDRYEDVH
jgi:hypothetical protein